MDDDNYAHTSQVELLVNSISYSSASAVTVLALKNTTPMAPTHEGRHFKIVGFPPGAAQLSGFFENTYGDANAIYSVKDLVSIGGYFEERNVPYEDWNCFQKLYLAGHKIYLLPIPLCYYRIRAGSMLRSTSPTKPIQLMAENIASSNLPQWIISYLYQASMSNLVNDRISGLRNLSIMQGLLDINHYDSEYPLGNSQDSDFENHLGLQLTIHNESVSSNTSSLKRLSTGLSIDEEFSAFKNKLKLKMDLIEQADSSDVVQILKASKNIFNVSLRDLEFGVDVFHHQQFDSDFDWPTCEIRDLGIFLHPLTNSMNSIFFPALVPPYAKFVKLSFFIDNQKCKVSPKVQASLIKQPEGLASKIYSSQYKEFASLWWRLR